jgi:MoxR-like ATPase
MRKADFEEKIQRTSESIQKCRDEIGKRVVGQPALIDGILMALIAGGHVLVEGVPGLAKTLAVKTVADVVDVEFRRIQFTPDLLPADLVGTLVYRQQSGEFVVRKGPVFTNIVLADEINRAPAKVQSALLESMEERQVTIGETTYPLPQPFFVLATQNPIEQEGTYPLPEAQLDRFMMKLRVVYPSHEEELMILRRMGVEREIEVNKVFSAEHLKSLRKIASAILVDERIEEYIVQIVTASRAEGEEARSYSRFIDYGGSTRGTLFLYRCAKIKALFEGRTFVIPDDVKTVVFDVMRHRIVLSYEAESEELSPDDVIRHILKAVPVP